MESPSISNSNALARFEFESGHAKDGTKVLMVEWEDDDTTRNVRGDWHISWSGKSTVLAADDQTSNSQIHRLYFLIPPVVAVPPHVTLTLIPEDQSKGKIVWRTNALPAIFPPELGGMGRAHGKKGVLHTIWSKRRLQVLQREIEQEKANVEGIAFTMAVQEKEWIEQNFGVSSRPAPISISSATSEAAPSVTPLLSPKTPGGSRLMDKLKGLKLSTTDKELAQGSPTGSSAAPSLLSPDEADVAVSSFSAFRGSPNPSMLASKSPQTPAQPARRIAAQGPPASVLAQQQNMGMGSLDAFAAPVPFQPTSQPQIATAAEEETSDELFAKPMSPRSPEMTKSPFTFTAGDTMRYIRGEQQAT